MSDFNEIVDQSEKSVGAPHSEQQMESFRSTLEKCQLGDLGFQGSKFTWSNCREVGHFTNERLDGATTTKGWCDQF